MRNASRETNQTIPIPVETMAELVAPKVTIEESITPAHSATSYTREHRYASKCGERGHAAIEARIEKEIETDGYRVRWNCNRGNGWAKGWRSVEFAAEAEAMTFMVTKWAELVTWLVKCEPKDSGGAAQVFSESLAGMRR